MSNIYLKKFCYLHFYCCPEFLGTICGIFINILILLQYVATPRKHKFKLHYKLQKMITWLLKDLPRATTQFGNLHSSYNTKYSTCLINIFAYDPLTKQFKPISIAYYPEAQKLFNFKLSAYNTTNRDSLSNSHYVRSIRYH